MITRERMLELADMISTSLDIVNGSPISGRDYEIAALAGMLLMAKGLDDPREGDVHAAVDEANTIMKGLGK